MLNLNLHIDQNLKQYLPNVNQTYYGHLHKYIITTSFSEFYQLAINSNIQNIHLIMPYVRRRHLHFNVCLLHILSLAHHCCWHTSWLIINKNRQHVVKHYKYLTYIRYHNKIKMYIILSQTTIPP